MMKQDIFQTTLDMLTEMSQEQLKAVFDAARALYKVRQSNASYSRAQRMVPGQKVRIIGSIKPKHWIGAEGVVIRSKQTKVLCDFGAKGHVNVSAANLELV